MSSKSTKAAFKKHVVVEDDATLDMVHTRDGDDAEPVAAPESPEAERVDEADEPVTTVPFTDLGLAAWLLKQCRAMGLPRPTPVQANCVPSILKGWPELIVCFSDLILSNIAGLDVIACSKTGSGKTAAFALPILHTLSQDPYGIYALVLTPTRFVVVE